MKKLKLLLIEIYIQKQPESPEQYEGLVATKEFFYIDYYEGGIAVFDDNLGFEHKTSDLLFTKVRHKDLDA